MISELGWQEGPPSSISRVYGPSLLSFFIELTIDPSQHDFFPPKPYVMVEPKPLAAPPSSFGE